MLDTVRYETDVAFDVHKVSEWPEIEKLLRRLDGRTYTDVMVSSSIKGDYRRIVVMGGGEYYYVKARVSDAIYLLEDPHRPMNEFVKMVLGGNSMEVSKSLTATLSDAIQAVKTFAFRGELDAGLSWQRRTDPVY